MELKSLMSGIAVVIDDKLKNTATDQSDNDENRDPIIKIVERLQQEWNLPFYASNEIPSEETWPNLLQTASFILLDWKLWPTNAPELEKRGVEKNIEFLKQAKDYFVPIFIFTNEDPADVKNELPECVYREESQGNNFIFLQRKADLITDDTLNFSAIESWIRQNASVYVLKAWEQAFYAAKKELFSSMYKRSPDWPRVFWKAYKDDSVDPSSSLTHLINDSLRGRIRTDKFEAEILDAPPADVRREDLLKLINETSFLGTRTLPENEIRCGDLFQSPEKKFLLNLRPDCDCVPREDQNIDKVKLYCIEGEKISDDELSEQYQNGHFEERVWESVAFAIYDGKSVQFNFNKLRVKRFSEIKSERVGRLLHPYLTRIQQRYGLYLQRQGLPRIPKEAILRREASE